MCDTWLTRDPRRDQHALSIFHALWSDYTVIGTFSSTSRRLRLYNTVVYYREAKPCKMELATDFNFTEVLQDYNYLHILLAPMKEKKVAHQAWIKVCTTRDYPDVFPQSILIHALSLHR